MKAQVVYTMVLWGTISVAVALSACDGTPKPIDDTEFGIAYKTMDGSWDTLYWTLPSTSTFHIRHAQDTGYRLMCKRHPEQSTLEETLLKMATIDFRVISKRLVLDTTSVIVDIPTDEQ